MGTDGRTDGRTDEGKGGLSDNAPMGHTSWVVGGNSLKVQKCLKFKTANGQGLKMDNWPLYIHFALCIIQYALPISKKSLKN